MTSSGVFLGCDASLLQCVPVTASARKQIIFFACWTTCLANDQVSSFVA
jgi:hypothetical protein